MNQKRSSSPRKWAIRVLALAVATGALGTVARAIPYYRSYRARTAAPWTLLDVAFLGAADGSNDAIRDSALKRFRSLPQRDLSSLALPGRNEADALSNQLLNYVFQLGEKPAVPLSRDLSWTEDPFGDKTWQLLLHMMEYINVLAAKYSASRDLRYLERAEALVLDWIDENHRHFFRPAHPRSWHDHATALRVRAWLPFWEAWRLSPRFDPAKAERLLGAIAAHAERLADPTFYTEGHNHGIDQDIALIAICTAFPELRRSSEWLALARARLARQVAHTISRNGIHLEHSPGYHIFTLGQLRQAVEFARRHGLELEPRDLPEILKKMARAAAWMLRPDGRVVRIGDTVAWPPVDIDHPILGPHSEDEPLLRYALTRGREGAPGELAAFFVEEGYAAFRDSWGGAADFERAFHVFFTAAAHRGRAHKQSDDLSFVLFARGRAFLEDAGYHSSHAEDPGRQYALHARAHNVVLVDGEGFEGWTARIEEAASFPGGAFVRASHENYLGFRHQRTLVHVRPAMLVLVDELRRKPDIAQEPSAPLRPEHTFDQLFHMPPDLEAAVEDGGSAVRAYAAGSASGPLLQIRQLGDGRGSCEIVRGRERPMQGWISLAHGSIEPAPVAIFRARGAEATFVTLIEVIDSTAELRETEN